MKALEREYLASISHAIIMQYLSLSARIVESTVNRIAWKEFERHRRQAISLVCSEEHEEQVGTILCHGTHLTTRDENHEDDKNARR